MGFLNFVLIFGFDFSGDLVFEGLPLKSFKTQVIVDNKGKDYGLLCEILQDVPWDIVLDDDLRPDEAYDVFTEQLGEAIRRAIPLKEIRIDDPIWMDEFIRTRLKKQKRYWKQYKRLSNPTKKEAKRRAFEKLKAENQKYIRRKTIKKQAEFVRNMDTDHRAFYREMKKMKRDQ